MESHLADLVAEWGDVLAHWGDVVAHWNYVVAHCLYEGGSMEKWYGSMGRLEYSNLEERQYHGE